MEDLKHSEKISKFYEDLGKMDLRFPVSTIARETGFSHGTVSEYINKKKTPSTNFLKKFYKVYKSEAIIMDIDPDEAKNQNQDENISTLHRIIERLTETIHSQQETIKSLTAKP